jgi:membrane protease YdiL (CAAX protease family)
MNADSERLAKTDRATLAVVVVTLLLPSLVTWAYFILMADAPGVLQQAVYFAGKTIQFGLPVAWVVLVQKEKLKWHKPTQAGLVEGFVFGLLVAVAMVGLYHLELKPSGIFDAPAEAVQEKLSGLGFKSVWAYVALGSFYAVFHSLIEEYYWRWFVFRQLSTLTVLPIAVAVSSVGFMAHHVMVLAVYFGWDSPVTYLLSLCVAVGGAVWAVIYHWSGSLYDCWISHCLVDAAIFIVGFDLAREMLDR